MTERDLERLAQRRLAVLPALDGCASSLGFCPTVRGWRRLTTILRGHDGGTAGCFDGRRDDYPGNELCRL